MFNNYPYTNFHELNLAYFLQQFAQIFQQWQDLLNQMEDWKVSTEEDISEWEQEALNELVAGLNEWKQAFDELFESIQEDAAQAALDAQTASEQAVLASSYATSASASAELAQAFVGSPLVASTVSAMTDHNKIYVYTGSESGYTAGNWYYYDGSAWTSGGVYNSIAVQTDKTLSIAGMAADAKATGEVKETLEKRLATEEGYNLFTPFESYNIEPRGRDTVADRLTVYDTENDSYTVKATSAGYGYGQLFHFTSGDKVCLSYRVKNLGNTGEFRSRLYKYGTTTHIGGLNSTVPESVKMTFTIEDTGDYVLAFYGANVTVGEPANVIIDEVQVTVSEDYLPYRSNALTDGYPFKNMEATLKAKSRTSFVMSNDGAFGDNGFCVFDTMDNAIRRGYEKDNGDLIYPIPSISAPVWHNIPRREIMSVIKSYTDRTDLLYGDVDKPDGDPKPYNLFSETPSTDESGNHYANCIAYVGAIVKGIRYGKSRYVLDTNIDAEYSAYPETPASIDTKFSEGWFSVYEAAQYFAEHKQLFFTDKNTKDAAAQLQFGDLLFTATDSAPFNARYLNMSHVVFVIGVIPRTNRVIVTQLSSSRVSVFGETNKPMMDVIAIDSSNIVFARPAYNLPDKDQNIIINGTDTALIKPFMLMGATIYIDSDTTKQGLIDTGYSPFTACCREYVPISEGMTLSYSGAASDGDNKHIVRAIIYDGDMNFVRYSSLLYNGTRYNVAIGSDEKYVRFTFTTAPSSYSERRSVELDDVYDFTINVS